MQNKPKEPLIHMTRRKALPWQAAWGIRLVSILLALLLCAVITTLTTGLNPAAVYATMFSGAFGTARRTWILGKDIAILLKKFEIKRDDQGRDGMQDNDISITTLELAKMIKTAGIQFNELPDEDFDPIMAIGSGAGTIFGATCGVMEAALRTVADVLTGEDLKQIDYTEVRGTDDIKTATYEIAGKQVKVAVTSGL